MPVLRCDHRHDAQVTVVFEQIRAALSILHGEKARLSWLRTPRFVTTPFPGMSLAAQFKNVLVLILLAATLVRGHLGHGLEAIVIAVIVLVRSPARTPSRVPRGTGARCAA